MSRLQLEAAMGLVITNEDAAASLDDDPVAFAASLEMSDLERSRLVEMASDLIGLAPGFISKRRRQLSNAAGRTIRLLGDLGDDWLDEYMESHAPIEIIADDPGRWLGWLLATVSSRAAQIDHPELVGSMARLELMRHRAFRSPGVLRTGVRRPLSGSAALRLDDAADLAGFEYDVRGLDPASPEAAALVADPCHLLVYRNRRGRVMVERVDGAALLDALIDMSGEPLCIDDMISVSDDAEWLRAELTRLYSVGALTT